MAPIKFSKNSKIYGNPNKVVSYQNSFVSQERRIFRKTFMFESVQSRLEKKWAKDTTSSAVTEKNSMYQVQREL